MALQLFPLGVSLGDGMVDGFLRGAQQGGLTDHAWRKQHGKGFTNGVEGNSISLAYEAITFAGAAALEFLGHDAGSLDAVIYGSGALLTSHLISLA
ncbi:MAG: hypothetical protein ACREN7_00180 [Candidatus Dormibacteria bacterium]